MRRVAAVVLAVACGACLPKKEQPRPCPGAPLVFHVTNENWATIDVYVEGAVRARLGTVTSFRTETFELPQAVVGGGRGMRLMALPVGAVSGVRTDEFTGHPGQEVHWRVTQPLRQAPATLRVDDPHCGDGEEASADSASTAPASDTLPPKPVPLVDD